MKTHIITFVLVAFMATLQVSAQQYITHVAQKGETLQSIAQTYSVTPYTLLQANKDLNTNAELKANTVLIIPLESNGVVLPDTTKAEAMQKIQKPFGFTKHRVRKRETLFSIAYRYQITEEQLKQYNEKLYSKRLKKGMVLQIPRFPRINPETQWTRNFEPYTVQPKETRWSVAHKYGISVDSLLALNPKLDKSNSQLKVGQTLQLPRLKHNELQKETATRFTSYTVPPKMTLYSLSKAYNISADAIVKLNPTILEKGGIQEGMQLRIPLPQKQAANEVINAQNYLFYEVKPRQTFFALSQLLKTSSDTLLLLNPALKDGLKAGMVLKIPRAKAQYLDVKGALVIDKVNLIDNIRVKSRPNLVFMLPFRLDRIDFDNIEKTRSQITNRKDLSLSLGLYTGALVALDSIAKYGVSVAVKTYDTELNQETVKDILSKEKFTKVDAIIGPLAPHNLEEVALTTVAKNIPVIAPVASESGISLNNIFYSLPRTSALRERMLLYLSTVYSDQNIIVIADANHDAARKAIVNQFSTAKIATLDEDKSLNLEAFLALLSEEKENWVFLETRQPSLVASVTSILNSASTKTAPVRMLTTSYNSAFESETLSNAHLSKVRFTYPSFYREKENKAFVKAYQRYFGGLKPSRYAIRGFDLTFDVLLRLAYKDNFFETANTIGLTEYVGNRFNYFKYWTSGHYNKACYLMQYDDLQIKEIDLYDF